MGQLFWLNPKLQDFRMAKTQKIAKFWKNRPFWRKILKNGYPFWPKSPLKMGMGFEAWAAHPCPTQIWVPPRDQTNNNLFKISILNFLRWQPPPTTGLWRLTPAPSKVVPPFFFHQNDREGCQIDHLHDLGHCLFWFWGDREKSARGGNPPPPLGKTRNDRLIFFPSSSSSFSFFMYNITITFKTLTGQQADS